MTLKIPLWHRDHIKCPKCNHMYLYDFKIEDIKENSHNESSMENHYKFLIYLICKNPLCNYDIEIKGIVIENPLNVFDSIKITSIK